MSGEVKYEIYCETEAKIVLSAWEPEGGALPTTCPNDANHTITPSRVAGIASRKEHQAQILCLLDGTVVVDDDGHPLVAWEA